MVTVTAIYASLLAILGIWLARNVIAQRRILHVAIGDGGDDKLRRLMRVQANFSEYAPLGLILIGFAEMGGAPLVLVHLLGAMLLVGRILHANGVSRTKEPLSLRVAGMILTFLSIGGAAATNLTLSGMRLAGYL
ncbi:MAG: glutathione metabolism protein [Rhizobiales bacterium]|nr:glutathione metabolism protein [Hyphomicrobiales bacterium]